MGDLLLCNYPLAAMPYYIEELSINIYSLEELCYLMEYCAFLPEETFFAEEFFHWIEREIGDRELAEKLREASRNEKGPVIYLELIFKATGYLQRETVQKIIEQLQQLQHKTVFERRKIRADRYLENKKYINAILEYRRILMMEEECKKNPVICGNIWHNQGTAFARLFLFKEAKECFLKAYTMNGNMESIFEAMAACRYMGADKELEDLAVKYGIGETELVKLRDNWTTISRSRPVADFELQLEELFKKKFDTLEQNEALMQILQDWKNEYQKNCG